MKQVVTLFLFFFIQHKNVCAQIVTDTINLSSANSTFLPFGINTQTMDNYYIYAPHQLYQKNIVPGDTIYGIAYYKKTNGNFITNLTATFDIKYKSGNTDSFINVYLITNGTNPYFTSDYFAQYYLATGFSGSMQYVNGIDLNVPYNPIWLTFMLDAPFVYLGGSLEIMTKWNASVANNLVGYPQIQASGAPYPFVQTSFTTYNNGAGWTTGCTNNQASVVIFHSTNPQPCNGIPVAGGVSGTQYICVGKLFNLYLVNPSSGPGIGYQWQQAVIGSSTWTNIIGATNAMLKDSIMVPTKFRCKTTCNNSGQSTFTNAFPLYPYKVNIDSVTHSVTGNVLNVHAYHDDTISTYQVISWNFGDSSTTTYFGNTYQKTYSKDGTYIVTAYAHSGCSADTFSFPITIGCVGSPTFINQISSSNNTTCPGGALKLKLNDTLPANYTVQWMYYTPSSGPFNISGYSGDSAIVAPNIESYYYNKATCTISGNSKYSNVDTITITPPPTAGTIQATNTTTNYYNFTNNGMSNAQSYKWFFGDGDSSTSLAPTHHYNLAGTYTVAFVVTNAGNGCTDTAFTTVNITTGVEETPTKFFTISPNPFNESFVVNCPSAKGTLTIVDATGKQMLKRWLSGVEATIDMKGYPAGVYLIKYQNDNTTETQKIIKN